MTTEKAVAANKANSKKSTGATTPEGKAAVAGNALKHGLAGGRFLERIRLAGGVAFMARDCRDVLRELATLTKEAHEQAQK